MHTGLRLAPRQRRDAAITEVIRAGMDEAEAQGLLGKNAGAMIVRDAIRREGWIIKKANASLDRWV